MSNLSTYLTTTLHQKLLAAPATHAITNVNLFACPRTGVCYKAGRHAPPCMYVSHTYLAKDRDMPEAGGHSYHACMPAMHVGRFSVCSAGTRMWRMVMGTRRLVCHLPVYGPGCACSGIRMCWMLVATLVDTHVVCLFRDQVVFAATPLDTHVSLVARLGISVRTRLMPTPARHAS